MTLNNLEGRVALVSGGVSGIELATVHMFLQAGARVALCDHNASAVASIRSQMDPKRALALEADVTDVDAVENLVDAVTRRFGRLDFLVNSAGVIQGLLSPLADVGEAEFDLVLRVNLRGTWLMMKHAIPAMLATGGGSIVNLASVAGLVGIAGASPYTASKHGVLALTKCAALEYGPKGIRVNAVCPGATDTPILTRKRHYTAGAWAKRSRAQHPASGRDGLPEEVALAVLFLCSEGASNIHGIALPVDGGRVAQ